MKAVEILAPAGSSQSLKAAVNASCDAVYVGGVKFGARAYADNFTPETMKEAIDFVHLHGKKIYMTVNTLLKNTELEKELFEYSRRYYELGVDAIIVQDLGVLHFLHENFPKLPLHASTQMSITMGEGAGVLKDMGVTRIVNARELSLSEIKEIRKSTDLEIESFVHGALCYCYSGKCLLSSMIGGRSGNRGRCAQPCRMPYQLKIDGENRGTGYYLSPKDMETLEILPQLIQAGIDSFKIEGRMKSPEYTAAVTSVYRKYTDLYYELGEAGYEEYRKSHEEELKGDLRNLSDIYNRGGFSRGYYEVQNGFSMLSIDRPNHSGVLVGKVIKSTDSQMTIELTEDINAQDVLEVRKENEALYEYTVKTGENKGKKITANYKRGLKIKPGCMVYRTRNNSLLDKTREEYLEKKSRIPVRGHFKAEPDEPICLTLSCYEKQVRVFGDNPDMAKNQPLTKEHLYKQLDKMGDTSLYFEALTIELTGELFIPVGKLNELRREGVQALVQAITEGHRRNAGMQEKISGFSGKKEEKDLEVSVLVQRTEQLEAVWDNPHVSEIILESDMTALNKLTYYTEEINKRGKRTVLALPHVLRRKGYELFLQNKSVLEDNTINGYLIRTLEEYELLTNKLKTKKRLIGDTYLYAMNRHGAEYLNELGFDGITAPFELNYQELREVSGLYQYMAVYTRLPVMISAQCLYLTDSKRDKKPIAGISEEACCLKEAENAFLFDRFQNAFPVMRHCRDCYNVIYNSKPLSLLSCVNEVESLNTAYVRLDFTGEDARETKDILDKYLNAYLFGEAAMEKENDITRGHFKRGIE
ncbi:peptidase U32 family protein [Anaerocolumna xylanovorans]|uniref:Putative protease n=1 Tax=Anaerocolumna xylanovorans DSM 12503 TaxID=1121345 RepID=A0A1M7YCE6_9FIRM|nr:U32 family peptidase [Anaerocolumna xylanovorans]SHO50295.1 putative protease [Anaerocolumna xylanovorans DSM 12503]